MGVKAPTLTVIPSEARDLLSPGPNRTKDLRVKADPSWYCVLKNRSPGLRPG